MSSQLSKINLSGNQIGDIGVREFIESAIFLKTLLSLDISKTWITDKVVDSLIKLLNESYNLTEVYIRWNSIRGEGAAKLFSSLVSNNTLRVFDLGWNLIGEEAIGGLGSAVQELVELLSKNHNIVHIDLSNNGFSFAESTLIGKALEHNHSVYGIHFEGNSGWVDWKQFIHPLDRKETRKYGHWEPLMSKKLKGVSWVDSTDKLKYLIASKFIHDSCWICDGWVEIELTWSNGRSGNQKPPIFAHFKHEGFVPVFIKPNQYNVATLKRMVPPTRVFYFFTCGEEMEPTYAKDYPNVEVDNPQKIVTSFRFLIENRQIELQTWKRKLLGQCLYLQHFHDGRQYGPRRSD